MKFILTEKLSDDRTVPTLSDGVPDWRKIFSEAHPIDENKESSTYEGMTTPQLWDKFFTDEEFKLATGINKAGAGTLLHNKFGDTFSSELMDLGFNKTVNPFLTFLENTYLLHPDKYLGLEQGYNAIHNAFRSKCVSSVDLRKTDTDLGKVIHNPNFYKFKPNEILNILEKFKSEGIITNYPNNLSETYKDRFGKSSSGLCIAILIKGLGDWDDTETIEATKLLTDDFLSYTEIINNIKIIYGDKESKKEASSGDEALKDINAAFFKGAEITKDNWATAGKINPNFNNVISYLALSAAGQAENAIKTLNSKLKLTLNPGELFSTKGDFSYDSLAETAKRLSTKHTIDSLKKLCSYLTSST